MEKIEWIDEKDRKYLILVENGIPPEEYHTCIRIGPPTGIVDELPWPEELRTRLHNILFDRKLWGIKEVRRQKNALFGAMQAALKADQHTLLTAYDQYEKGSG